MQAYTTNTSYLGDHIDWLYVLIRVKLMIQVLLILINM